MLADRGVPRAEARPRATASTRFIPWGLFFSLLVLVQLAARRAYAPRLRTEILEEVRTITTATTIAAMATLTGQLVLGRNPTTGLVAGLFGFATIYVAAGRAGARLAATRQGVEGAATLIVGAGRVGAPRRARASPPSPSSGCARSASSTRSR